jgi:hypothetical protein
MQQTIKNVTCPGATFNPVDIVRQVKQLVTDENGNRNYLPVQQLFNRMFAAMSCLNDTCEENVVIHTLTHMEPALASKIKTAWSDYNNPIAFTNFAMTEALQVMLPVATQQESEIRSMETMVQRATTTALVASNIITPALAETVPTMASQAETTLQKYGAAASAATPPSDFDWNYGKCCGCGEDDHKWTDCPHKTDPRAVRNAEVNLPKLRAEFKKRKADGQLSRRGRGSNKSGIYGPAKSPPEGGYKGNNPDLSKMS